MSLAISPEKIRTLLLIGGSWIGIKPGSFYIDSYEYIAEESGDVWLAGGQEKLVPAAGFHCISANGESLFGPLTSIVAVSTG